MSAKSERAARMSRAANPGNRVAAGFPIVDGETLWLRVREYREAEKRVEQAQEELAKLRAHIVKRGLALADKGVLVHAVIPVEWMRDELARRYLAMWDQAAEERRPE